MVIERYLPVWGGAENQLRQLAGRLAATGTQVEIITRRWSRGHAPVEEIDGVLVRRVGIPGTTLISTAVFVFFLTSSLMRRAMNFDVLHTHGAVRLGALVALVGQFARRPTVAKIATAGHIPGLRESVRGQVLLRVFRLVDATISMTEEIDEELASIGVPSAKIARIGNGVDTRRFSPAPPLEREDWRRERGLAPSALVAVYAGRFVRRKGMDILINAWKSIEPTECDAHLFLIGSGSNQKDSVETEIRQTVAESGVPNVSFAGPLPDTESYLNYSDLFLFPSRREGYPNALLEAMSAGAAVIAMRIGGCTDLVTSGETGLLVDPDDPKAFAKALRRVIADNDLRHRLQQAARRQVQSCHTIEAVAAAYSSLYRRLAVR